MVDRWSEKFSEVAPQILDAAMREVGKKFTPTAACGFPVPAHVWEILNAVHGNEVKVTAESAWQKALHWSRNHFHPDVKYSDIPQLDPKTRRALGSAGGPAHLFECSEEETQWARKRFLEAFAQLDRLEEDEFFLTDAEAKKILYETIPEAMKRLQ